MNNPVIIGTAHLFNADCREVLASMPDNSVDSVVTDPPYELGFMGKGWDATGIANNVELWADVLRVLKPGGHLLAFSGSRTYHRMTCAIEDAGFDIRDQIMWIYGSGFPKSHNLEGDHEGWGTALKPAHEPICVARKPLTGTVASNVKEFGTGAINIDACRIESEPMPPNTGKGALPRRNETEIRVATEPSQPHDLGRWPANVIHDGSDEVLDNFPDAQGQQGQVSGNEPTANGFSGVVSFGGMINRVPSLPPRIELDKSAARFFYCAKTSKEDRNEGCNKIAAKQYSHDGRGTPIENAYQRNSSNSSNSHPTVKPTDLMRYLVRLVTPPQGTVLDVFMGSGSTGKAAWLEGFKFIGIEKEPEYFEIAKARVKSVPAQDRMFA
jgi:DNA modification methylase